MQHRRKRVHHTARSGELALRVSQSEVWIFEQMRRSMQQLVTHTRTATTAWWEIVKTQEDRRALSTVPMADFVNTGFRHGIARGIRAISLRVVFKREEGMFHGPTWFDRSADSLPQSKRRGDFIVAAFQSNSIRVRLRKTNSRPRPGQKATACTVTFIDRFSLLPFAFFPLPLFLSHAHKERAPLHAGTPHSHP